MTAAPQAERTEPQRAPQVEVLRSFSAGRLNDLANHPDIRPFIADASLGKLDLSAHVRNADNVFLLGEHGGCVVLKMLPGIYEVHTLVRPEGRGPWALSMAKAVLRWMFCNTDACEVLTRVPHENRAARALAIAVGMQFEFTRPDGDLLGGKVVPIDCLSITIQQWIQRDQTIEHIGAQVHAEMLLQAKALGITEPPHADDKDHNRIVGACHEMMLGGQVGKGSAVYNRWALVARHATVELVSVTPPAIRMDIGMMRFVSGKLEIIKC